MRRAGGRTKNHMAVAVELSLHPLRWFRHTPGSMKYQQHQQGTDEAEAKLVGARRLLNYCDSPMFTFSIPSAGRVFRCADWHRRAL